MVAIRKPAMSENEAVDLTRLDVGDFRLLRVFMVVVDCGGFSAAQTALGIGQSTISTHMSELETRLGMRLCSRGRSGFLLTEHGRLVYNAAKKLFAAMEDFRSEVGAVRGRLVGGLNIGVLDHTVTDRQSKVHQAIDLLKRHGPELTVTLIVASAHETASGVLDGRLHIGICTAHHRLPALASQKLYVETSYLYCGSGNPLFSRAPDRMNLDDLSISEYAARGYEEPGLRHADIGVRPTATAYHMEGIAHLILSGHYLGYLPEHYARYWVKEGRMRPIRPDLTRHQIEIHLIMRKSSRLTPAMQIFRDTLIGAYSASDEM